MQSTQSPKRAPFWSRYFYREAQFVLDLAALIASFVISYLLRFDFVVPHPEVHRALAQLPLVVLTELVIFYMTGMNAFVWRYISMAEVAPFARAAFYSTLPLLALRLGLSEKYHLWRIPLSVILMNAVFAFGGLLALRVLRRALYERYERNRREAQREDISSEPIFLVGAGRAGVLAIREIQGRGDMRLNVVGFIDDDPLKLGTVIHGVRVLGTTSQLAELARELGVHQVIITIAEANRQSIRRIVETCERTRIKARIIPGLFDILQGRVAISRFRDVQIEDLLGRVAVHLDQEAVAEFLSDKVVMVTGSGGSIGSELVRQIPRFQPRSLLLVERSEPALFEIQQELRQLWPSLPLFSLLADVGDEQRMDELLAAHRPQVILHAAAHKHVPLMELNPGEAIKNNIFATHTLATLAGRFEVEAFVLISTDKAVRPTSIMGASKRVAELMIQEQAPRFPKSRFLAVRFGNVIGSTGSVVPIFKRQIERGGPVTVTHPEMQRYFMTIPEAAQLVLEAGAIGGSGEILILDMGQPIKIVDLAHDMIRLSGFEPDKDVRIVFTGLRPGEKLQEELSLDGEGVDHTRHPKVFVGRLNGRLPGGTESCLERLGALAAHSESHSLRVFLSEILPEAQLGLEPGNADDVRPAANA
ncbi:MAG TPA: nucleoside-diphosphate sugar epimerase/dehydratase [Thermoanaerobaculia bacterium]|nr:nucleoside-diphosphate sugar epimerase/dehydratase [Thermoanaerobaculia bacterium]